MLAFFCKCRSRRLVVSLLFAFATVCSGPGLTASADVLTVVGTGDSQTLLRLLGAAYENLHPGLQVVVPDSIGSSGGIRAVASGKNILARTARPLSSPEKNLGLTSLVFGSSPLAFIVNNSVSGVESLTSSQVVAIFSGELADWAALGGPEQKIYLVNREEGDSSWQVLMRAVPGFAAIDKISGPVFFSTPESIEAIAEHAYTIGYGPLAMLQPKTMRALNYNGIAPTAENVAKGVYPLSTPFGLVWRGTLPPLYRDFVDFLFTVEAHEIMVTNGVQPADAK